jgi:hypothetical protein
MSGALQAVYRNLRSFGAMIVQVRAIFWGGTASGAAIGNLISTTGVIASDTTTVGSNKSAGSGAGYGGDKGIFGYGTYASTGLYASTTNLVSNTGVVAADISQAGWYGYGVQNPCAANYGTDKAFFQGGSQGYTTNMLILVTNTGVVGSQNSAGGTLFGHAATGYGIDTAITLFGGWETTDGCPPYTIFTRVRETWKVSNTGVFTYVDATAALPKSYAAAARYGADKAISVCGESNSGQYLSTRNLISNTGVVAADTATLATGKTYTTGVKFGADRAIIAFGGTAVSGSAGIKNYNLISNTGTVASDSVAAAGVSIRPYTPSATQFG